MLTFILTLCYLSGYCLILGLFPVQFESRPTLQAFGYEPVKAKKKANPFGLMLGYFAQNNVPLIYVLNSVPGFATRIYNFACLGCGGTVGEFILSRADLSRMGHIETLFTAIYTVEEVKKVDTYCGGQTKAAMLSASQLIFSEAQAAPYIRCAVETMQQNESEFREHWAKAINAIMKKSHDIFKERSKPPPPDPDGDVPF